MHRVTLALRLLATACIASAASAQTAAPPNVPDVVELTPFEVNTERDVGYTATSALAGGRTDTALKHTPSAISVLTREFLDDIAMTDMRDMAEWTVNASPRHDGGQPYELNIRGLGSSFPSRNYFVWYVNSDSFATERLEFARGPNGVLFGDGGVGGLVTTYSKRPNLFRDKYTLNLRGDSEGGLRASVDVNQRVGDRAAVRLNLLKEEGRSWRDRYETPRDGAQLSAAYRLTDRTTVRAEAEWGLYKRPIAPVTSWIRRPSGPTRGMSTPARGLRSRPRATPPVSPACKPTPIYPRCRSLASPAGRVFPPRPAPARRSSRTPPARIFRMPPGPFPASL